MRGTIIYAPGDIRSEELPDPILTHGTDAIIRAVATCICGSDLWPYRGIEPVDAPQPMGHEYVGIVEEVGDQVDGITPGQFVVGSFATSDNTCPNCRNGYHSACVHGEFLNTCQAEYIRIPHADGTLVATDDQPDPSQIPSLLAVSDVMGTGWYAAVAADVRPGSTVVVVGDGAVGLCGVIAAKEFGAERIIAMSRHPDRQRLATIFGATDIVSERGEAGVARIHDLTKGIGADSVLECVGTSESVTQALRAARTGGNVGLVGIPQGVQVTGEELVSAHIGLRGGPAPVRRFLPDLIDLVLDEKIDPGQVFDLTLPLADVADGYKAMNERAAIKALLQS